MATVKASKIPTTRSTKSSKASLTLVQPKAVKTAAAKEYKASAIILSGSFKKPESKMSPIEKMERLQVGISKKELETLKIRAELDYDKLANLLSVTRATLINKPTTEKFNPSLSERILGLADIYSYGYDVFEDEEKFNKWMFSQNRALGGMTPYEVCNNQFGREEVKILLEELTMVFTHK